MFINQGNQIIKRVKYDENNEEQLSPYFSLTENDKKKNLMRTL